MGTVYEAVQLHLHKRVAVKVMVPELAENPEALGRFRREVEITSQLSHPHVIQLLDFGATPTGQPYLVMEFLDGEDMEQRLRRVGRMPLSTAVDLVRQIGSALSVIHAKGIVHRDLKAANVYLLTLDGIGDFAKVVDFGISKVRAARTQLTRDYTMVGTPEGMSPEQATARPDDVDHRTDQWALACLVWRMLSGALPFQGGTLKDLLAKIVHEDPPPLSRRRSGRAGAGRGGAAASAGQAEGRSLPHHRGLRPGVRDGGHAAGGGRGGAAAGGAGARACAGGPGARANTDARAHPAAVFVVAMGGGPDAARRAGNRGNPGLPRGWPGPAARRDRASEKVTQPRTARADTSDAARNFRRGEPWPHLTCPDGRRRRSPVPLLPSGCSLAGSTRETSPTFSARRTPQRPTSSPGPTGLRPMTTPGSISSRLPTCGAIRPLRRSAFQPPTPRHRPPTARPRLPLRHLPRYRHPARSVTGATGRPAAGPAAEASRAGRA